MRRPPRNRRSDSGFALVAFLALFAAGVLYYIVSGLAPSIVDTYRNRKTQEAMAQARDALLGYALQYRDQQIAAGTNDAMYGYLPLPDLGTSAPHNIACASEGCDTVNFSGNAIGATVIGRFPWRLFGTEPIRDGHGECLWMMVSGSHQRILKSTPMNWDVPGQIDVVVANGSNTLGSILNSVHDRPVAIIFSPGSPLPNQHRDRSATDDVTECGGNYDVANYLGPDTLGALNGVTNYFGNPATPNDNNAFGVTSATIKAATTQGMIFRRGDSTLWPDACPAGSNCTLVANNFGLPLTPDMLFGALRKNANFRTDVNAMLDRMVSCLRDQMAAGATFTPTAIAGYSSPTDKSAGRIQNDSCFNNSPPGYFNHWQDMFFVAKPTVGTFNVTVDSATQSCNGVLVFAGQRGAGQSRTDLTEQSVLANYLEGTNLASFTPPAGGTTFSGQGQFDIVSATQSAQQDIVRCIPTTTTFETISPQNLVDSSGNPLAPLASYDPGTRTLTLGSENATTGNGVPGGALYGCAWTPETSTRGNGFRAYFTLRFMGVTGGVGSNGFVFAAVDGENNTTAVCGEAGSHLGYSGNNGTTNPLVAPKIGIEFDQGRNAGTVSGALDSGRDDPCGTSGCGGTVGYNSHSAIVYWGSDAIDYDDNVHGYPLTGSQTGNPRPAPQNPSNLGASPPGIAFIDYRAHEDVNSDGILDSYLYHVRVEVTPTRNVNTATAELSNTTFTTRAWIVRDSVTNAQIIAAMQNTTRAMAQLYPTATPALGDVATLYDVAGAACNTDGSCSASGYTCGTDNVCYRPGLRSVRLGFTNSQRTQDQRVIISNFFASWLP
jgi:hypothetical protein